MKSTVLPDIVEDELVPTVERASGRTDGEEFGAAVDPEFQREGSAVHDFMHPDKIVVGTDDERALDLLAELYQPLVSGGGCPSSRPGAARPR